jgi:hypothetical protein
MQPKKFNFSLEAQKNQAAQCSLLRQLAVLSRRANPTKQPLTSLLGRGECVSFNLNPTMALWNIEIQSRSNEKRVRR